MKTHAKIIIFWGLVLAIACALFVAIDLAIWVLIFLVGFTFGMMYERDFGSRNV